jgi:hypothetical protein
MCPRLYRTATVKYNHLFFSVLRHSLRMRGDQVVVTMINYWLNKKLNKKRESIGEPSGFRIPDTLIKRLGNVFRLWSSILIVTTASFSDEYGCHLSSPLKRIMALLSQNIKISVMSV